MKLLVFSDTHLHNWNYASSIVDGMNSRLLAQAEVFDQIAEHIRKVGVDHIVFCGDLFHTHSKIDAAVLKVAYEGITKIMRADLGYSMDILVGNHDTDRKDMSIHALHWLNSIPCVRVIDKPTHNDRQRLPLGAIEYPQLTALRDFSFLPYTEDEAVLKKFLAEANPICFMHQGLVDVPMASGWVVNEIMNHDMIPDHVRHVFTGHYHPFTMLEKATVVGSVMQHTWADINDQRGFLVVDTDTLGMVQHKSRAPEFMTLNMCGVGSLGSSNDNTWVDGARLHGNFVRVVNFAEAGVGRLRKEILAAGALSVEFVIKPKKYKSTIVKAITGEGLSVPELVREYETQHNISKERSDIGKELMK